MCSTCHDCGAPLTMSNGSKEKQENLTSGESNGRDPKSSCNFCVEKQDKESLNQTGLSTCPRQRISPTSSLTSSDSTVSCSSDILVEAYSNGRGDQDGDSPDSSSEDPNFRPNGHLQNLSSSIHENGIHQFNEQAQVNLKENCTGSNSCTISGRKELKTNIDNREAKDNVVESASSDINGETGAPYSSKDEMDGHVWSPPESEDQKDDEEGRVVNYDGGDDDDDDDEYGDGTMWGKPSSLSSIDEEGSGSYRFKEEKKKAMYEVMNGKFKTLVGQLLKSVEVSPSGEDGDSWVDIVTSLSWEAASFVKPDAIEGKAMDLDGNVKVKCVATGSRNQSQVIRGLVFKKHAAHKHMPTKYKNPRLLLIRGALGLSSSGLSSFESMDQEKNSEKSVLEIIDICHPNVVLVEKTVSRDIQECILPKGITLVFDMKLHRLERVARCTGSPILSTDILAGQKLKHCDHFHFEKFVEEHNATIDGGKKPSKTLMFIEGCPTRLGCTILLKGAHSDELKRVKCVVQCAVIVAYHLILETSFLLDQRAMFSTIPFHGVQTMSMMAEQQTPAAQPSDSKYPCFKESSAETDALCTVDIPIYNGCHDGGFHNLDFPLEGNSMFSYEPYNPIILSGLSSLSASLKKVIGDSFPMSKYFGFNERESNGPIICSFNDSTSQEPFDRYDVEVKGGSDEDKVSDNERPCSSLACCKALSNTPKFGRNSEDHKHSKDDISSVLDSESILVLMSSRNASRGTICEQSHLSHIKFYRNFDVPLGKFLLDNLLNQSLRCATCNEPPEAHFYYYAHHNKQLTFQVKRLPKERELPGQTVGKLWMWSRCGKCKSLNGNSKSTKRVLISTAARGLSFGKFLELSFSNHSSFSRLSSCGHSLQKDFLYFFGLGPMVAMLRYSAVATYSVSLPPQKLEFNSSIRGDLLKRETDHVYKKGVHLFDEVAQCLRGIASRFSGSVLNLNGGLKEFSDIEEMLMQERSQFEVSIQNIAVNSGNPDVAVYRLLSLNWLMFDLLLESCIWDQRLHSLLSSDSGVISCRTPSNGMLAAEARSAVNSPECGNNEVSDNSADMEINGQAFVESIHIDRTNSSEVAEDTERTNSVGDESFRQENRPLAIAGTIPISADDVHDLDASQRDSPNYLALKPTIENPRGWIWTPFPELRMNCLKDLQGGYVPRYDSVCRYTTENFPNAIRLINEEGSRLHIPLGMDEYMVSDYEDEFSSIIACALALLKDVPISTEVLNEDSVRDKATMPKMFESLHSLTRISSMASPHWSSFGSSDSDGTRSPPYSEEIHFSSFNGLNLLGSLVSFRALNPEVPMGFGRSHSKGKYSVLCLYASQFRDLRSRCCPSELDYIASLSRCRNWDAKGGKSKSFFAKTLDDRFIVKEIKKTEFESFAKFAPDYFRYMSECFEQGNQTCLAKILGIYQVTIRQTKSGKEMKHDLMVMENLSFGRHIDRQYDLKGALHARFNSAADGPGDVLLDQNFVNDMNASPLYVGTKSKRILQRAVWNDTTFLNSINVMDYSLLVGVDTQSRELVCGIIDYLRQYTWDKQLETWVKSSLVVPKNQLPTIISPREYKKRFRKFITTYFLSVPDHWCSQRSSNPCKLCGTDEDDSSSSHAKLEDQGEPNGFLS